jgi:hypothetical protein
VSSRAELCTQQERDAVAAGGFALFAAMEAVVSASPGYKDTPEPERTACILRLCVQAIVAPALDRLPGEPGMQTYVAFSEKAHKLLLSKLEDEINMGARDFQDVLTPKGSA